MKKLLSIVLFLLALDIFAQSTSTVKRDSLKNGIPIFTKPLAHSKITTFYIVCRDTMARVTPNMSGIPDLTARLMQMGSTKYSYNELRYYLHDTQTSFTTTTTSFGTVYGMTTLGKYFDGSLERLLDTFLNSAFKEEEYNLLIEEVAQDVQHRENDGISILLDAFMDDFYKGTPFEAATRVTNKSLPNLTLNALKDFQKTLLDAKKISIVAVGYIPTNLNNMLSPLESLTKRGDDATTGIAVSDNDGDRVWPGESKPVIIRNDSVGSAAYIIRAFSAPDIKSDDYMAARIAAMIYDDILFNVVRENYGVCYSVESFTTGGRFNYGVELLYRVTSYNKFAAALDEARKIMADGKVIESRKGNAYVYTAMEEVLARYLNKYVNEKYSSGDTSLGVANKLAGGLLQYNDVDASSALTDKVMNLQAADITRVFNKYWCQKDFKWYAIAGGAECKKIRFQ